MVELILVRHGETAQNREKVYRGRLDVPLSDTGRRQAELLADALGREDIDIIYSSPLQRALRTAGPLARRRGVSVTTAAGITDMDIGEWQGLPVAEVAERYPELARHWRDTPEQVRMPGGESLDDVARRAVTFLENAVARRGAGKMVLVSHRVVLKVLVCSLLHLTNASFWMFKLDMAGITRFRIEEGRTVLTAYNSTAHLDGLGLSSVDF